MWQEPLADRARAAVELVERQPRDRSILVLSDADVDGVAAATIVATALQRAGRRFRVRLSRRRDPAFFDDLLETRPDLLITADLGASEVTRFVKSHVPTIVLDHHVPSGEDSGSVVHVNPHLVGEDGSSTASGAAVAYVFATALLESVGRSADDVLPFAFVGAGGDRYHGGTLADGVHGRLAAYARDRLPWRSGPTLPELPVGDALAASLDPFLLTTAGDPAAGREVAERIGVDPRAHISGLDAAETRSLASWLTAAALSQGAEPTLVEATIAPRPAFPTQGPAPHLAGLATEEIVLLVDAVCRTGRPEVALAALLGSTQAWQEATTTMAEYRQVVTAGLRRVTDAPPLELGRARLVRIDDGRYSGCVADRIMAWLDAGPGPIVCLGPAGARTKVSLRARSGGPRWQLDQVAARAARRNKGIGGGHELAAGASLPSEHEGAFLEQVRALLDKVPGAGPDATQEAAA